MSSQCTARAAELQALAEKHKADGNSARMEVRKRQLSEDSLREHVKELDKTLKDLERQNSDATAKIQSQAEELESKNASIRELVELLEQYAQRLAKVSADAREKVRTA